MGLPNKDEVKGKFKEGKGSVKEDLEKYLRYMPGATDRISIQEAINEL